MMNIVTPVILKSLSKLNLPGTDSSCENTHCLVQASFIAMELIYKKVKDHDFFNKIHFLNKSF